MKAKFFLRFGAGMVFSGYWWLRSHPSSPLLVLWRWRLENHLTTCASMMHWSLLVFPHGARVRQIFTILQVGGGGTGLRERGNDTSKSTGRSGRQKAATRRNMRREERVTVQGPVKEQQPEGMSHRGEVPAHPLLFRPETVMLELDAGRIKMAPDGSGPQEGVVGSRASLSLAERARRDLFTGSKPFGVRLQKLQVSTPGPSHVPTPRVRGSMACAGQPRGSVVLTAISRRRTWDDMFANRLQWDRRPRLRSMSLLITIFFLRPPSATLQTPSVALEPTPQREGGMYVLL